MEVEKQRLLLVALRHRTTEYHRTSSPGMLEIIQFITYFASDTIFWIKCTICSV